jgi:hypothetical protein
MVLLIGLLAGCSEKAVDTSRPHRPTGPPIESDPKITFDRTTIYYVHTDTLYPENNGIYRANAANPLRNKVVDGLTVTSPSASPDESTVAYLENGLLRMYDVAADSVIDPGIDSVFSTFFFVTGDQLITTTADRIFLIEIASFSLHQFRDGRSASPDISDFFHWIDQEPGQSPSVTLTRVSLDSNEIAFQYPGAASIRAISRYANTDRYAYVTGGSAPYTVWTRANGTGLTHSIASTTFPHVLMAGYDVVIFTGDDGRFDQSNFDGTVIFEYRGAEDGAGGS